MGDAILRVSGLRISIGDSTILDGVNFAIRSGKIMAIVGPNGAGKTTFFRALLGLVPYSGKIEWKKGIRMGYVPQGLMVTDIPITVREFLSLKFKTDFTECLETVGLNKRILDLQLGKLSGGELQRVLLAWSIVDSPDILLFDEPTSGVDVGAEEPIYEKIKQLKESTGITVLIITHNHHVVLHYTDQILGLNRKQTFFGNTAEAGHDSIMDIMTGISPGEYLSHAGAGHTGE